MIPFDIWSADIDTIHKIVWPLNQKNVAAVRNNIEKKLFAILSENSNDKFGDIIQILMNILINEYLSVYENMYLIKTFDANDIKLKYSNINVLWNRTQSYLADDQKYDLFYNVNGYNFNTKQYGKYLARKVLYGEYRGNSLVFNPSILTYDYLKKNNIHYSSMYPYNYFPAITQPIHDSDIIETVDKVIFDIFDQEIGDYKPQKYKNILHCINKELIGKTEWYYRYLTNKSIKTLDIYSGTGANYYTRLIGQLIKKRGGNLHCFEHGEGKYFYKSSEIMYSELGVANKYYTFTVSTKNILDKYISNHPFRVEEKEIVVSNNKAFHLKPKLRTINNTEITSKTVIYVANAFRANKTCTEIRLHDIVYLEWQKYILSVLAQNGYTVYVKYHPESILLNKKFTPIRGVEYLYGKLSQYLDWQAVFLIDYPMSTTFGELLMANKKMLFIKLPFPQMHDSVLADLRSCISVIDAYYDEKNRVRVNLNEAISGMQNALESDTRPFVQKYYGRQ